MILGVFEERLSDVPRWSIVRTIQKQSVAEHSFRVALMAPRVAIEWFGWTKDDPRLYNLTRVALLHDQMEAFTGDIPSPAGRAFDKDQMYVKFHTMVEETPAYTGEEQQILKVADYLEALIFIKAEISMGNDSVRKIRNDIWDNLLNLVTSIGRDKLRSKLLAEYDGPWREQQDPLNG